MPPSSRQVADNAGRTFIENYSPDEFLARNAGASISGTGLAALKEAQAKGKPVILVTGHFGNYEAPRAALVGRGYNVGGLYRPATNKFFNDHYAGTFTAYGGPIFAQGHRGTAGFVRHLKAGGILVLLFDQHVKTGKRMNFLGRPARTALSASELALRYGAELIPFYGTRQPDGLTFAIELEAPDPAQRSRHHDQRDECQPRGPHPRQSRPVVLDSPTLESRAHEGNAEKPRVTPHAPRQGASFAQTPAPGFFSKNILAEGKLNISCAAGAQFRNGHADAGPALAQLRRRHESAHDPAA